MKPNQSLTIVATAFVGGAGIFFGLYRLLTRSQRRETREIRHEAARRGWRYRGRRWEGNPTAFRIDGSTTGGLEWLLTHGQNAHDDLAWCGVLTLSFPGLAGEGDVAILEREPAFEHNLPSNLVVKSGLAARSTLAGMAAGFFHNARELPVGLRTFDAAYQILALPQVRQSPIDAALAERILHWPEEAVQPHSILAWRDPFAFHVHARLPGPPNWAAVAHMVLVGEDLSGRLPAAVKVPMPTGWLDTLIRLLMRP